MSFLLISIGKTFAQSDDVPRAKVLPPYYLPISHSKTTNLLFPFSIKSVDIGSSEVLAQVANGAENILQIKSAEPNFQSTNLSVITSDGRFFPFTLVYDEDPAALNLSFFDVERITDKVTLQQVMFDDAVLADVANQVAKGPSFLRKAKKNLGINLSMNSIYVYEKTIWFSLTISNESLIEYDPAFIRFFIQDKKRSKRTAVQTREINPIFITKSPHAVGEESASVIVGFPVFTLPNNQQLVIRMAEKDGGRNMELRIKPRTLLKARLLPEK
jgi:conjugative transposon TraN protein